MVAVTEEEKEDEEEEEGNWTLVLELPATDELEVDESTSCLVFLKASTLQ